MNILKDHKKNRRQWESLPAAAQTPHAAEDEVILSIVENGKRKKRWPAKKTEWNICTGGQIDKIWSYSSCTFKHVPIAIPKNHLNEDMRGRAQCALCSKGKVLRMKYFMCKICEIPLCTMLTKEDNASTTTHFDKWHSLQQLTREAARCYEKLKEIREARRMNREEGGGNDGSDDNK